MIGLGLLAAASFAVPFAPPLDRAIACTATEVRPAGSGIATIRMYRTLRFFRANDAVQAMLVEDGEDVDAPEPYRGLILRVLRPFHGIPTTVRFDGSGRIVGVVDGARAWSGIVAAERGLVAAIQRDPAIPAAKKAQDTLLIRDGIEGLSPEARDARLIDGVAMVLAPPLPALRADETRAFAATLRSPAGMLASRGDATLAAVERDMLRYRIETRTDPDATRPAVRALLDRAGAAVMPDARARIEASAASLDGAVFAERTDLGVDRATGLLRTLATERFAIARDGGERKIDGSTLNCSPK